VSVLGRVVRSGVGRRRVQSAVVGLVAMIAVTAAVLGGSLLLASKGPFDRAFAQQHGAHLTVEFDAGKATAAQLAASAQAAGVSAAAGPFPFTMVGPVDAERGIPLGQLRVVGRADPGGAVDAVTLVNGTWATAPGQLVLDASFGNPALVGTTVRVPELPGSPTLTVVGVARSVSRTADAWVVPAQLGTPTKTQMVYRLAQPDQVDAGRTAIAASVPAGAYLGAQSWLTVRSVAERSTALFLPFLVAFGVLGLVMAVLIVGNVIAGAVGAGVRRVGILKAVGFTPSQVVRAYMMQALLPSAVGAAAGVVVGNLLTIPVLSQTDQLYATSTSGVAPWLDAAVVAGVLALVAVTAWAAALRAGRLRVVDALAVGRTPAAGRGRWAARIAARLPVPRSVGLGLAQPFARPVRAGAIAAAIVFGASSVTFAAGMITSLVRVQEAKDHTAADVVVRAGGPGPGPFAQAGGADLAAVPAKIQQQAGTARYFGIASTEASAPGVTQPVTVYAFTGDASWGGYQLVEGRWFSGPGEAVAITTFLTAAGAKVGDTIVLTANGTPVPVRIVGEVFNPTDRHEVFTDAATVATAAPDLRPDEYQIQVTAGTDPSAYLTALDSALPDGIMVESGEPRGTSETIIVLNALSVLLTGLLVAVAGLGVLNMVVLDTRERVHDLGVLKAVGMVPRQTVAMVLASVVLIGVVGGVLGAGLGVAVHTVVVPAMGHSAGIRMPAYVTGVFGPAELVPLALGGVVIAVLGALLPAGWAARTRTATALRTE
jgi:putative ABC transport system permease protein